MRARSTIRTPRDEAGIALLISIFVLLLISVVAISLIVSSGTETSLSGNYRSSASVYYAASAGLEEARGRLSMQDPNSFRKSSIWTSIDPPGGTFPIGTALYVLNPGPADPTGPALLTTYSDQEYASEFGSNPGTTKTINSVWTSPPLNANLSFPVPLYKWVRINAVSEKSLNLDVDADNLADSTSPLYFDNTNRVFSNSSSAGPQVFELTALAVQPNSSGQAQSSQKLVQYLVAAAPLTLPSFLNSAPLAALTLSGSPGNSPTFKAPTSNQHYYVQGTDSLQGCTGSVGAAVPAIGLFGDYSGSSSNPDIANIISGIPSSPASVQANYTGVNNAGPPTPGPISPDVEYLNTYPTSFQTPAQVDAIAQYIIQNADAGLVPAGSAGAQQSYLSGLGMSPSNPMTVIANGDLDLTNWNSGGYGLLLVTGTLTWDPNDFWYGMVVVIGQGKINNIDHGLDQQIGGAVFVAKTRDPSNNLWTGRIGGASVSFDPLMQGNGIRYSSCWIKKAQPIGGYKVLSFHEIAQ